MTQEEPKTMTEYVSGQNCRHGLYKLYWHTGGYSLAAVGSDREGRRWFMPCNWISGPSSDWSSISHAVLISEDLGERERCPDPSQPVDEYEKDKKEFIERTNSNERASSIEFFEKWYQRKP